MNQDGADGTVLAVSGNYAVVRLPGRNFPAAAIQGDSLKILQETVRELSDCLAAGDLAEAAFPLNDVAATIAEMLEVYEGAARDLGLELPYFS
ncbi:hypothetical protein OG753_32600 [Streptomyces sp. NBC_00029]|uniref:DUF6959 family protein n=1 Tax=Streptomyces sp. NBC_00029 TaxID=2903613 RepID=UPI00325488BD